MLLRLTALLTVLAVVSCGFSLLFLDRYFDQSDANGFRDELERVSVAFALERSTILDYAHWDDAERFVQGRFPRFVDTNFSPDSLRVLGYTAFAFSTLDGQFIASKALASKQRLSPMPAKVLDKLQSIVAGFPRNGLAGSAVSMFWIDGQAFLVSYAAVTDSANRHAASGYLFFLRELDPTYLDRLRSVTSSRFSLIEAPEDETTEPRVSEYWHDGQERFKASRRLAGLPAAVVVDDSTRMAEERFASYSIPAWNILFMVLASLGGIYLILHRRVLDRLQLFSRLCDRYHREDNLQIRWPVSGCDELDCLGASLNDLMGKLETQRDALEHRVEHDHLTGIANRVRLLNRLAAMQCRARRVQRSGGSLLLIDLDGFKEINDRLGHAAGDEVLRVVARRLRERVRHYDTVARLGGDEFAVLLQNLEPQDAHPFAQGILDTIEHPIEVMGHPVRVECSLGIAGVSAETGPTEALHHADLAMYEAKRLGKARFVQFDANLPGSGKDHLPPPAGNDAPPVARASLGAPATPPADGAGAAHGSPRRA